MEDYKNEIEGLGTVDMAVESEGKAVEEVIEQRPSTKYGRTAYQQQMQAEQEVAGAANQECVMREQTGNAQSWQSPYQQNMNKQQDMYQQSTYQNYTMYQDEKPEIRAIFASILMGLVGISAIISFVLTYITTGAYEVAVDMDTLLESIIEISAQPVYSMISSINMVISWAIIAFLVMDIMQLYRAQIKITGAILFAIFLRPAYFIWRAHLLKQKKILPIIFAVSVYLLFFLEIVLAFMGAFEMVMRTM